MRNRQSHIANRKSQIAIRYSLFALLLLAGCGRNPNSGPITASGFVEGDEIAIAAETGGRVAEVVVNEGDPVTVGQTLVQLDGALLQSQRGEAAAAVAAAEANLARVRAGARPSERTAAAAALAQAQAQRDGALRALENTRQQLENPQELNAQIAEASTQVALAEQGVELTEAQLNATEIQYSVYAGQGGDTERAWSLQVRAARDALEAAQAQLDGARRYQSLLYATRADSLTLQAQLHAAEAQHDGAEAAVAAAQAALDEKLNGPTPEEIALAQAQLRQAQAALALVDVQVTQLTLTSPITGVVAARSIHAGETAAPGNTLLTLANLDQVTLVIYVPETRIGQVRVGQAVDVRADTFPDRIFPGRVTRIANEAEFTPRNVQTQQERVNLVFAVEISIPNPDHVLKPGIPADATILDESAKLG